MSPAPRGWAALAALGPLTDRLDARCTVCHAPALTQLAHEQDWRCADHPPQPGEWGHALNWTPRTAGTCAPTRCYCSRCSPPPTPAGPRERPDELLARRVAHHDHAAGLATA